MKLFISFSGGESSAKMTINLLKIREHWSDVVVIFANTGFENEETLDFVKMCDERYGFNSVWVEAVIDPSKGKGTRHRIVDFTTASRDGEPFREMVAKYGIPNASWPHCTRELKTSPMYSYIKSLGWKPGEYDVAIGIRADEQRRLSRKKHHIIYPLADIWPMSKPDVNEFWNNEPERLNILGFQGNCKTCWKKSTNKLLAIMEFWPDHFNLFESLENDYPRVGNEFEKDKDAQDRVFFRKNMSTIQLRELHSKIGNNYNIMTDESLLLPNGEVINLNDEDVECGSSCEVNPEELL